MALILIKFGIDHPIEKLKISNSKDDDSIVFIQDGIYWNFDEIFKSVEGKKYLIREDFYARGYEESDANAELINYSEFIDIIEKEEKFIG